MFIDQIERAVGLYCKDASKADRARLRFFEGLFKLQQERADELASAAEDEDGLLSQAAADADYIVGRALLETCPVTIDPAEFAATCTAVADQLVEGAGLEPAVARSLGAVDWGTFCLEADLALAGRNPSAFVEKCLQNVEELGAESDLPSSVFMMVPMFALRAHLQPRAEKLMGIVSKDAKTGTHERPLLCPVCGSAATASRIGPVTSLMGGAREQYCGTCGTVWPFDRVRCGVCGTRNQSHLHYFNEERDFAHRLQSCDECGQYQRMVMQNEALGPVVMEVEDVIMAKLDRIALDPRFRAE